MQLIDIFSWIIIGIVVIIGIIGIIGIVYIVLSSDEKAKDTIKNNSNLIQTYCSIFGCLGIVAGGIALFLTKEQTSATNKANELAVLPYVTGYLEVDKLGDNQFNYKLKITNHTDKPAINIHAIVTNFKNHGNYQVSDTDKNNSFEYIIKDSVVVNLNGSKNTNDTIKEISNLYGIDSDKLKELLEGKGENCFLNNDKIGTERIFIFYKDLLGRVRTYTRAFKATENNNIIYITHNHINCLSDLSN